jgi:hypothetical protein
MVELRKLLILVLLQPLKERVRNRATTNVLSGIEDLFQEYKFKVLQVNRFTTFSSN